MISIIVPVYKVEPYIHQCVESILNQTYRDIEVLLIDDGSPDQCGEICDEYAEKDHRIRVFHTENKGLSAARNLGLREAKGEYIGFVDSDDWIDPDMYEILMRKIEETGADISVCGVWFEYDNRRHEASAVLDRTLSQTEAINELAFNHLKHYAWNKLYSREIWERLSFPEGHVFEDVSTIFKTILASNIVISISNPSYHYRQRKSSIATTLSMQNLIDYWKSYYDMYLGLKAYTEENSAVECKLLEQVANGAAKTWRWIYGIPKDQRDKQYLNQVSIYVREHFSLFGNAEWKLYLRVSIFLARYVNEISFAICYYMNLFYRLIAKREYRYA